MKQRHTTLLPSRFGPGSLTLLAICLLLGVTRAHAQTKAYLTNGSSGLVTVLDTSNDAALTTVPVGTSPSHVAVSKDGLRAYVSNTATNTR